MCNGDWNIDNRRWSKRCPLKEGQPLKKTTIKWLGIDFVGFGVWTEQMAWLRSWTGHALQDVTRSSSICCTAGENGHIF